MTGKLERILADGVSPRRARDEEPNWRRVLIPISLLGVLAAGATALGFTEAKPIELPPRPEVALLAPDEGPKDGSRKTPFPPLEASTDPYAPPDASALAATSTPEATAEESTTSTAQPISSTTPSMPTASSIPSQAPTSRPTVVVTTRPTSAPTHTRVPRPRPIVTVEPTIPVIPTPTWTTDPGRTIIAFPGDTCRKAGARGITVKGQPLVCAPGPHGNRWKHG